MSKALNLDPDSLASNPRASLRSWKRYESIVYEAFTQHPLPLVFTPTLFSPATVASQLRDAIRGAMAFSYPFPAGTDALVRWWGEVTIRHGSRDVIIGPRGKTEASPLAVATKDDYTFPHATLEEVEAFRLLLDGGLLEGPITITNPPDISVLLPYENTTHRLLPDGSLLLL